MKKIVCFLVSLIYIASSLCKMLLTYDVQFLCPVRLLGWYYIIVRQCLKLYGGIVNHHYFVV